MTYRQVFTVIPECSLGYTDQYCTKDCKSCDKAKFTKLITVPYPSDMAYFTSVAIDKNVISLGEVARVTIKMDKPIDINYLAITGTFLKVSNITVIDPHTVTAIVTSDGSGNTGDTNVIVTYSNIVRSLKLRLVAGQLKVLSFKASDDDISEFSNVRLDMMLSRPLLPSEDLPVIEYDKEAFELASDITANSIAPSNLFLVLQSRDKLGLHTISAVFKDDPSKVYETYVTVSSQEIDYATKEDIDALFPEVENHDIGSIWATRADIDSLFYELHEKK